MKSAHARTAPQVRIKPLSKLGVFLVPTATYLAELQRLGTGGGSQKEYTDQLYPVLAHIAALPLWRVAEIFRITLSLSDGGTKLNGLESVFLSCLQSFQTPVTNFVAYQQLALAGIAAWTRYSPAKERHPLVVVNRLTNQIKRVPAAKSHTALKRLTASALLKQSVWNLLKQLESEKAGETNLSSNLSKAEQVSDITINQDCAARIGAIGGIITGSVSLAGGGVTAAGAASAGSSLQNSVGSAADVSGLLMIAGGIVTTSVILGKCTETSAPQGSTSTGAQQKTDQVIATAQAQLAAQQATSSAQKLTEADAPEETEGATIDTDATATALANVLQSLPVAPSDESDPDEWDLPDFSQTGTPGATQPGPATNPATDQPNPAPPTDEEPAQTPEPPPSSPDSTPNPDGTDGNTSKPPGFVGPWPPDSMPNPDDSDPPRPVSMPNGEVFVSLVALGQLLMAANKGVSYSVGSGASGIATIQLSVTAAGLGAG